jgi:hypothetical protein
MVTAKDLKVLLNKIENKEFRPREGSEILKKVVQEIKEHEEIDANGIDNYSAYQDYHAWDRGR